MSQQIQADVQRLRPTQLTVSMAQVAHVRGQIRGAIARGQLQDFVTWRSLHGVLGPGSEVFLIHPHAVARALADEAVGRCLIVIEQDLSHVLLDRFWIAMERQGWVVPLDAAGRRRAFSAIPRNLFLLEDDPYRTLAIGVREAGACKDWEDRAAEIAWANFLRTCVPAEVLAWSPEEAMQQALQHARSEAAKRLPGWKAR